MQIYLARSFYRYRGLLGIDHLSPSESPYHSDKKIKIIIILCQTEYVFIFRQQCIDNNYFSDLDLLLANTYSCYHQLYFVMNDDCYC